MGKFKIKQDGYYGLVELPAEVFKKLNSDYFISGSDDDVKFMCANDPENNHLRGLGVDVDADDGVFCDWYKLVIV